MGKRHAITGGVGGVQLSLIVTPMLDMSFQILSFFVMTYHPSALEGHIDGNLLPPSLTAATGPMKEKEKKDFPATEEEPPLADAMMVVLKTVGKRRVDRSDGEPLQILLKRPEAPTPVAVVEDDVPLEGRLKILRKELEKIVKEPGQSRANVKIEADGDLKHQYLMEVYDACKQAGYQNISFVAPARERPPE